MNEGGQKVHEGSTHMNNKYGQLLTDQTKVLNRWKEHLESLFPEVEDVSEQPDLEVGQKSDKEISEEEVRRVVSRPKGGKAPGTCGIMPEMLKAGGEVVIEWLVKLFNEVWEEVLHPETGSLQSYLFIRRLVGWNVPTIEESAL